MRSRPAESVGVAAAVALVVAYVVGLHDAAVITAIGTVVGFLPAAVTWIVELVRKPPVSASPSSPPPPLK